MKKHLVAIFTYFVTFFVSFVLVVLLTEKPQSPAATSCFPKRMAAMMANPAPETVQQAAIRKLLENDKRAGREHQRRGEDARNIAQLVDKMRSLDNPELPVQIRSAYKIHTDAWGAYARHLNEPENLAEHDFYHQGCLELNKEINDTYDDLLHTAKVYGVDFQP